VPVLPTALVLAVLALDPATTPLLGWGLQAGPRAVSFRVLAERDAERGDRPLQIGLWLPTTATSAPRLAYRDYFALSLAEKDLRPAPADAVARATASWLAFLGEHGVPQQRARQWQEAEMLARRDAPAADGRFPLVLVAQGNGQSAVDQAALAELLASHGYAVATSPSPMNISGPMQDAAEIGPRAEEQAADLAFVRRALAREPHVDTTRVAIVAHSFGARGALLFAMREPVVRALVSLDGGIGTTLGREALVASTLFSPRGLSIPVLHAYEELDDFMKPDFELLRKVAGERLELLGTRGMHHAHFTSLGFAAAAWPDVARATGAGAELPTSLAAVVDHTLATLDCALGRARRP
jgi:dienelactone hydrolase